MDARLYQTVKNDRRKDVIALKASLMSVMKYANMLNKKYKLCYQGKA